MKKVLVIAEQRAVRDFIFDALRRGGYAAVDRMFSDVEAVVLDSELKEQDFVQLCQSIRQDNQEIPILLLVGREQKQDMVTGLMTGADDCLLKPFSSGQLIAHLEALFGYVRRRSASPEEVLSSGPFLLDTAMHTLDKLDRRIRLTRQEFETLKLLMRNVNQEISGEEILRAVWGPEGEARQVDMTIRALRAKLEEHPAEPEYIVTVRGRGYKWCG